MASQVTHGKPFLNGLSLIENGVPYQVRTGRLFLLNPQVTQYQPSHTTATGCITMSETCETCRFHKPTITSPGVKVCHRYPPIAGAHPVSNDRDWCGEYQHNGEVSHFPVTGQSGTPMPPVESPKDDINHKNGLSKIYHGGHTYYPYHGHLMHDSDCICCKHEIDSSSPDSDDLV